MLEFMVQNIAPLVIGLLTVQVMGGFKYAVDAIANLRPAFQRIVVVVIAVVLTQVGSFLNVVIPTDLVLITADNLEAVFAAVIAMAVHFVDRDRS